MDSKDLSIKSKVRAVLGSSASSIADIDKVLGSKDVTPEDKVLLETKKEFLKSKATVASEKLYGGGNKPGIFQWIDIIKNSEGPAVEYAKTQASDFVEGQNNKLKAFQKAIDAWDRYHNMPWTQEGNTVNYIDGGTGLNTKHEQRQRLVNDPESGVKKESVDFRYGNTEFRDIYKLDSMLQTIKNENEAVQKLAKIAGVGTTTETAPESQKGTQEAQKTPEQPMSPEETKEAPAKAEELPTPAEVAKKISTGADLTAQDFQVQDNDPEMVEEELQLLKDKEAVAEPQKPAKKKETVEEVPKAKEESKKAPEADYSKLTKTEQKWMKKFDEDAKNFKKFTKTSLDKRARLMEKARKKPKPKSQSRAEDIKDAAVVPIGGSEQEAKEAVKQKFKKMPKSTEERSDLTQEDADELQRMYEEDLKLQATQQESTPVKEEPKKKEDTISEIYKVALDTKETISVPVKEGLLQLIKSNPGIKKLLEDNKIDIKDC